MVEFHPGIKGWSDVETIADAPHKPFSAKLVGGIEVICEYTVMQVAGKEMIGFTCPECKATAQ